ncbi:MAG: transcriptional regulator, partial [Ottowia sp.]|nr:transcriptional regulator [Ottowia sp.]
MNAAASSLPHRLRALALACCAAAALPSAAQQPPCAAAQQCLARLRQMPAPPSYVGTFVISGAAGDISSARIWHVREGEQRIERVEALTGAPRLTYRHGQSVTVFFPHKRLVRVQERDTRPLPLPERLQLGDGFVLDKYYDAQPEAPERVAG